MSRVCYIIFLLLLVQGACSQDVKNKLVGSWATNTDYEFPDILIFRSDGKYFVYNSNSVDARSLSLTDNLPSDDIVINGAYTTMTEKGIWEFDNSSGKLLLKQRDILEEYTDFSDFYGRSKELNFTLNNLTKNAFEVCFEKEDKQVCEKYAKTWSYSTEDGEKVFYKAIEGKFSGTGDSTKELILSGYETELRLTYNLAFSDKLSVRDNRENELFSVSSSEKGRVDIVLKGVTKLLFTVKSVLPNTKWSFEVEVK